VRDALVARDVGAGLNVPTALVEDLPAVAGSAAGEALAEVLDRPRGWIHNSENTAEGTLRRTGVLTDDPRNLARRLRWARRLHRFILPGRGWTIRPRFPVCKA
jgi:hypothetical protein